MRSLTLAFAALLAGGTASAAAPVGYAQATGYFKKDTRPTLYQPLNLLDGRENTAWCTPSADPLNDHLTFGFKGTVTLEEVRIYTGNGFDDGTFKDFSRAKKLSIKGPTGAQTFTIADQRGLQALAISPPLQGAQFTVEILDQYPADDPDAPVCLTDVVFYAEGKPLNGAWLTPKLKYDKQQAAIMGTWFAGYEGAPDRFLSFYFDGTYRFVYDPYDPQVKDRSFTGAYDVSGNRLTLELPGKGKVTVRMFRDKGALVLDGDLPEDLKQKFRDRL